VLYRDGVPIALLAGGEVQFVAEVPLDQQWEARKALLRSPKRLRPKGTPPPAEVAVGAA